MAVRFPRKEDAPRGVVIGPGRGASGLPGGLERLRPPADLAPFVEHVWIVTWDVRAHGPHTAVTLPHPAAQWVTEGNVSEVMGVFTGRFVRVIEGAGRVVGVRFRAAAFTAFTDRPLHELVNVRVPASEFFPVRGLARALATMTADEAAARIAEILRAKNPRLSPEARKAQRIADGIVADRELISVARVSEAFSIAPLALQRLFRKTIGVTPKWIIQRARIHEAVERIAGAARQGKKTAFAELAVELGFTDQAHFTRTFSAFVGSAPRAYALKVR